MTITEVSQGGSVPELKVINTGFRPVLLIDGEELVGAKQNRVLNTTILIKGRSEAVVPVSCTEAGRWGYSSAQFADSGVVMAHRSRARKSSSVSSSLASAHGYNSNQGEVWNEIAALHMKAGTTSPTGAMKDVFKAHEENLQQCLATFGTVPGQTGILVVMDGKIAGFDLIPHAAIYAQEHSKLIKSYVIDALTNREPTPAEPETARVHAMEFLRTAADTEERAFPSNGFGTDYRYQKPGLAGAALVHEEKVVHAAFFALPTDAPSAESLSPTRLRRSHYTEASTGENQP